MSQSQPAQKPPNLWAVASVTYGAVIAVAIVSIVAYYYLAPKRTVSQQIFDAERSMAVGSVWMPIYPGAIDREHGIRQAGRRDREHLDLRNQRPGRSGAVVLPGGAQEGRVPIRDSHEGMPMAAPFEAWLTTGKRPWW